jgi:DNA repair exonuclease SbcCD ATPase subunit
MKTAEDCVGGECSIDDVNGLIAELKEQEEVLEARLESIMNMVAKLQHINEKEGRKTDEVRQFVKDLLSVFSHEVSWSEVLSHELGTFHSTTWLTLAGTLLYS